MYSKAGTPWPDPAPGSYVLILQSKEPLMLTVGALGPFSLRAGFFAYVGSAFGPGGVAARCAHHAGVALRPRWHIDYLRAVTTLEQIWYTHDPVRREHAWAALLAASRGSSRPSPGFGASDCRCPSHLFHFPGPPSFESFRRRAGRRFPGQGALTRLFVD